ncbi:myosin XVB isoform X2 [Hemicordylus capensis]|uniref:myosin XVB isoform X2 n=1 Tax=Hemicordylus capensis TaxID=884348 RepID=UPI002302EDE6|nr:myosin XVB isoform X2 [Hemicordylus capensis]
MRSYGSFKSIHDEGEEASLPSSPKLEKGHHHAQANQVTEVSPPEVKAKVTLSLPPNIDSFPLSSFMKSHLQEGSFPALGQPLQQPLTRLDAEHRQSALQLNKLILRFINDKDLQGWQEELLGNYIASRGLANRSLRNELLSQVVSQLWKNPDLEQCQRGWVLMAVLLGSFTPSSALEKPLLKFVSDHGLEGYNGVCQRKILTSMKQMESYPELSRAFPPTRLEWTTNQRKGKMVLDVYTYEEERFSAEVESWTTGEQYAGWILSSRGLDKVPRGWSVSMFTGTVWQDLLGCDFVLDLIGETEEGSWPSESSPGYPITPEWDEGYSQQNSLDMNLLDIPPAPGIQAPSFPPPSLPPDFDNDAYSEPRTRDTSRSSPGMDHYVDDLFIPLLHHGSRAHMLDMESEGSLTGRMKGGGKIGPTHHGAFPGAGYPGMMQMPAYQAMPVMGGMMPPAMPLMPGLGGMGPMPGMVPSVDPTQLVAAQQQAFINQQALLMAQQMTLQAMTISQQQQQQEQQRRPRERSPEPSLQRRLPEPSRQRRTSPWRQSPESPRQRRASPRRQSPESPRQRRASPRRQSPEPSRQRRASPRRQSPESPRPRQAAPPSQPAPALKLKELNSNKDTSVLDRPECPPQPAAPIHTYQEKQHSDVGEDSVSRGTFQKKIEYFQRMGLQTNHIQKITPSSKKWNSPKKLQLEGPEGPQRANPEPHPALPPPAQKGNDQEEEAKEDLPSTMTTSDLTQKPEPSQEIRNVIKTLKNQPVPPPKPIMPLRNVSNVFLKKGDPKKEALAKLGIVGLSPSPPSSASPERSPQATSPPPPPPGKLSSSIREKQLPLMNLFARPLASPPASGLPSPPTVPPPPLPAPAPSLPSDIATKETSSRGLAQRMVEEDDGIKTQLLSLSASVSFSYANPSWKLFLRKEVFYPKENFSHPYCLNLLCNQIMRDTYSDSCIRISKEERRKMKDLLTKFQVGMDASSIPEDGIKKRIVVAARDNWANYFSRLFLVKGENGSDVQILGVSHRGLQLLKRVKGATISAEHLKVLCSYSYADVLSLELMGQSILQFSLKNEQLILHSPKALQIKVMVELFLHELKQDSKYVIALRNYITDDKSLLNFKKGDLISLLPMEGLKPGWQFGSIGGRCGLFPSSMVQPVAAPSHLGLHVNRQEEVRKSLRRNTQMRIISKENSVTEQESEVTGTTATSTLTPDICHYTMAEFAAGHFREAHTTLGWNGMSAEQKNPAILVQHTKVPIQEPLLFSSFGEMNELATKSFMTLMRLMGDQPGLKGQNEVDYIFEILQLCKKKKDIQDEVYCQVIKQITQNPRPASCRYGWQLLKLLTGYFLPSNTLMPYATKYLQQASSDNSSPFTEIARTCQDNLRKIVMYGGRQHLPSHVELEAVLKERSLRHISTNLPGGLRYSTKIKTFTVAADVLKEISEQIGVIEPEEVLEFAISVNKDNGKVVRPLHHKEYIHDHLLEKPSVELDFCRITWKTPLHFENTIYVNIHYHQLLQNYMNRKQLLPHTSELEEQVGTLALLQHWARGAESIPSIQELIGYIPDSVAHLINRERIQATVTGQLETMKPLEQQEAKISFIEHVTQLPLFGYNVYPLERISIPGIPTPCVVGVNQEQIIVMDGKSQSLHCLIPLKEMQLMRTLRPLDDSSMPGLEINYGSAEDPKTIWFELKQAKALYHTIGIITEEAESQV